ncbi:MAG: hypothetical protein RL037_1491 [Bacteroidota bacterium]|jgi:hypothetical protein
MKILVLLSISLIVLGSCNKYADGPSFSLLTRMDRISNEWILEKKTLNNSEVELESEVKLTIESDGTYSESTVTNPLGQIQSTHTHGTWIFLEGQGQVSMTESSEGSLAVNYEIRELKSKRLKLRRTINNNVQEWTYISR